MEEDLRRRLVRGLGANSIGQIVNIGIQVIGLPCFLSIWGAAKYGEWLLLSSMASYLAISDVGFASAAANTMTMAVARGDRDEALRVFQSAWALVSALGLVVAILALAIVWLTPVCALLPLTHTSPDEAAGVLTGLILLVLATLQVGVVNTGFRCEGRFAFGKLTLVSCRLGAFLAQLLAALLTQSMLVVAGAGALAYAAGLAISIWMLSRKSPWLTFGIAKARRGIVRRLCGPALTFTAMPVGDAISNQGMLQVVAATLGPKAVVTLAAHRTIANAAVQVMNIINAAVWPEISAAFGTGNMILARKLHHQSCRATLWAAAVTIIVIGLCGPTVLDRWTGGAVQANMLLLGALLSVIVVRSTWLASSRVPMAINRHQGLTGVYLLLNVLSLCLAAYLMSPLGLPAIGCALFATDLCMSVYVVRRSLALLDDSYSHWASTIARPPCLQTIWRSRGVDLRSAIPTSAQSDSHPVATESGTSVPQPFVKHVNRGSTRG